VVCWHLIEIRNGLTTSGKICSCALTHMTALRRQAEISALYSTTYCFARILFQPIKRNNFPRHLILKQFCAKSLLNPIVSEFLGKVIWIYFPCIHYEGGSIRFQLRFHIFIPYPFQTLPNFELNCTILNKKQESLKIFIAHYIAYSRLD